MQSLFVTQKKLTHNQCDVLFFCHDNDRSTTLNGKSYSPLIDSVREDFEGRGFNCRSVALPGSSLTGKHGFGSPLSLNMANIRHRCQRKLPEILRSRLNLKTSLYGEILDRIPAPLVITIGSTEDLATAARNRGIFHVELLHGIGLTRIKWGWEQLPANALPQGILSLDKISTKTFLPLRSKGIETRTIPHPFYKRFRKPGIARLPPEWNVTLPAKTANTRNVLVSINWGYAGDYRRGDYNYSGILENGLFPAELAELVEEETNINWHFRLHPLHLRQRKYVALLSYMDRFTTKNKNSEWRTASTKPFPCIAMHCDANIGMSSGACYDAAAMGLRSLMLCPSIQNGSKYATRFQDLVREGYVTKCSINKTDIKTWAQNTRKTKPRLEECEDRDWEDALQWMLAQSGLAHKSRGHIQRIPCKE